ncbi:hypothetical protein C8J57DRAFT_1218941 [Mycena rebaudengoi]|nr:hypothetical protein C8J57DRAFT_1218941 [Mycena rebaudengoi]
MNILCIGASRNIGYLAALRLLKTGATLTFLLRRSSAFAEDPQMQPYITSGHVRTVQGDALVQADVQRAWDAAGDVDTLIFTLGGVERSLHPTKGVILEPHNIVTQAMLNVVCTMPPRLYTTTRIIAISSNGLTPEGHAKLPFPMRLLYGYLLTSPHQDKIGLEFVLAHCGGRSYSGEMPGDDIMGLAWKERVGLPPMGALKRVLVRWDEYEGKASLSHALADPIMDSSEPTSGSAQQTGHPDPGSKRRRLRGACDVCKQRKTMEDPQVQPDARRAQDHVDTILIHSTAYIAPEDLREVLLNVARYCRSLEGELAGFRQLEAARSPAAEADALEEDNNDHKHGIIIKFDSTANDLSDAIDDLSDALKTINVINAESRFFGKSNSLFLVHTALAMKENRGGGPNSQQLRRPQFWSNSWEKRHVTPLPDLKFPSKDLLEDLLDIYFTRIQIVIGLLHRPTFEASIARGLHSTNRGFGSVVLAVCALAAQFSEDPRVVLEGTNSHLSAGWEWYQQVRPFRTDFTVPPTLYDLQLVGVKIVIFKRVLLDLIFGTTACYCLPPGDMFDRIMLAINSYDIDYPIEVDDEYWENIDPEKALPAACRETLDVYLMEILGLTHKTIRPRGPSLTFTSSALNKWVDAIPDHLRWDPTREQEPFATQSACLYTCYYHVQIQVHRTFIPSPANRKPLSSNFPSLAICANSARSCSHVMEAQAKRSLLVHPQALNAMLDSAVVLSLNVWGGRKTGAAADPHAAANDVQKCIRVLQMYERHWQSAGRYCDTLYSIGNVGSPTNVPNLKRGRNSEAPLPHDSSPSYSGPRSFAGSQRVSSAIEQSQQPMLATADVNFNHLFGLPIYTEDLGNLPVYESFEWDLPFGSPANDSSQYLQFNTVDDVQEQWEEFLKSLLSGDEPSQ